MKKDLLSSETFKEKSRKYMKAITGDYDQRLVFSDEETVTEEEIHVNLEDPIFKDLSQVEKAIGIRGKITQKAFHRLFTDFSVMKDLKKKFAGSPKELEANKDYLGVLEGRAVEMAGLYDFPGTKGNVSLVNNKTFESLPNVSEVEQSSGRLKAHKMASLQYALKGKVKGEFQDEELKKMFEETKKLIDEAKEAVTTSERAEFAEKIATLVQPLIEEAETNEEDSELENPNMNEKNEGKGKESDSESVPEKKEPQDSEQNEQEQEQEQEQENNSSQESQESQESSEEQEQQENSDSQEQQSSEESEDSQEENQEKNSSESAEQTDEQQEQESESSSSESMEEMDRQEQQEASAEMSEEMSEETSDEISEMEAQMEQELEELKEEMEQELEEIEKEEEKTSEQEEKSEQPSMGDIDYTNMHDGAYINDIHRFKKNKPLYSRLQRTIRPYSRSLIRRLQDLLEQNEDRKITGQTAGYLTQTELWRKDGKIFSTKRDKSDESDLGIVLLIDESGSMYSDDRIVHAREAAVMMAEVCEALNIPLAVLGHTAVGSPEVQIRHFINFGDSIKEQKSHLTNIAARESNRDGMAIQYAGEYLLRQPYKDKLLMVIADGLPHHPYKGYYGDHAIKDCQEIIKTLDKKGVSSVGIAIGDGQDEIQTIFKQFISIPKLEKLPTKLVKLIERNLFK